MLQHSGLRLLPLLPLSSPSPKSNDAPRHSCGGGGGGGAAGGDGGGGGGVDTGVGVWMLNKETRGLHECATTI